MEMLRKDHRLRAHALLLSGLLVLGVASVVVSLLAYVAWQRSGVPPEARGPAAVATSDPRRSVRALGRLQPEGGVISVGIPGGDQLRELLVQEGDVVEQGQVLARLQSHADRLAEKELAAGQLAEAQQRLAAAVANGEAQLQEARIRLRQCNEIGPLDLAAQEARVGLLEEQWQIASRNRKRFQALDPEVAPRQELERLELAEFQARGEWETARALLDKACALQEINRLAAEAQLRTEAAALERARSEVPIQSLMHSLRIAEERWQHTLIRAPIRGTILKILARPGEVVGVQPILQMGNTQQMVVIAEVYETDVSRVRVGQRAVITSPALSGRQLHGTVQRIGSMIARNKVFDLDPTADVERRVVEVTIRLDASEPAARLIQLQVRVAISPEAADGE